MSDDDKRSKDDEFGERLGRVLRAPEAFDDGFEDNLVAAIRADRSDERAPAHGGAGRRPPAMPWWRRPVTVRFSPVTALAVAASIVGIVTLGALNLQRSRPATPGPDVAQIVRDTVHVVRFVFVGEANSVSLVGDFNAWASGRTPLAANSANGTWTVSLPLSRGRYEYAFIVDGKRWVADPFAPGASDEFETSSSIVTVGS